MHTNKTTQPLDGVKCVVNTCHYHGLGDTCTASKITIEPRNATDSEETDCATFRPHDDNSLK